jgi:hypothetical protein
MTEYWKLDDAVNKRVTGEDGSIQREPVVILRSGEDKQEMPLADFLQMQHKAMEKSERIANEAAFSGVVAVEQVVEAPASVPSEEADKAETIKEIYASGSYDHLFDPKFSDLLASLTEKEQAELDQYQIEQAAIRNPKLFEVINKANKDELGNYPFDDTNSELFLRSLRAYGVEGEPESEEEIMQGIEHAKAIVDAHDAAGFLQRDTSFMTETQMKELTRGSKNYRIRFKGAASIDPMLIKGVGGFDSWAGRGSYGDGSVATRETYHENSTRKSIEQITDYATRDTQLPKMEGFALNLILTDDGPVYYGTNAHRVAAARLRGEQLRFDSVTIMDARNK